MNHYDICLNNDVVGYATIERTGLYATFDCKCTFPTEDVYRILVKYEDGRLDLGVCVPEGLSFVVRKQIPVKLLGAGEPKFSVIDTHKSDGNFVPISEDSSFLYLSQLTKCKFYKQYDQVGILLCDQD